MQFLASHPPEVVHITNYLSRYRNRMSAPCRRNFKTGPPLSGNRLGTYHRSHLDQLMSCLEPTNNVHAPRLVNKRAYFLPRFSINNYNYGTTL
ncbi:hypothetical protein J6590_086093 [Homalodisca vitripennis]|nr:hypothetical protein J6590_098293 [Homalodisca vitripennis]KAG8329433.1 hypothetical protein J6590_086093 [Homalodisca vitripennis]